MTVKKLGFNPFHLHTQRLEALMARAAKSKDPAWFLYTHGARTHLFMLEALTRLYLKDTDNKSIEKWFRRFKRLEDSLGVLDYYDVFISEFKKNSHIPKNVIAFCERKRDEEKEALNDRLRQKDWLGSRLGDFEFAKMPVEYDQNHIAFLKHVLKNYVVHIGQFVEGTSGNLTELDGQVHELRRKVRWLSMYAMALNGLIQLKKADKPYAWEKEFLTKEVMANPYNKVAAPPKGLPIIYYNSAVFYALSKLISDLAIIKDNGLRLELLSRAIRKTKGLKKEKATQEALKMLGKKHPTLVQVLQEASQVTRYFFMELKVLDNPLVL